VLDLIQYELFDKVAFEFGVFSVKNS